MSGEAPEHGTIASWPLTILGPSQGLLMDGLIIFPEEGMQPNQGPTAGFWVPSLIPPPYITVLKDAFYSSQGAPAEPRPGEASLF